MTVIVCGSREATHAQWPRISDRLIRLERGTVIVHGDCRGVDEMVEKFARAIGLVTKPYPVSNEEWRRLGPSAGPRRNQRMLDENPVNLVIAFPAKESRGTKDMIRRARRAGIPVEEIPLRGC